MKSDKVLSRVATACVVALAFAAACSGDDEPSGSGTAGNTGFGGLGAGGSGGSTQGKGSGGKAGQGKGGSAVSNECPTLSAPPETGKSCPQNGLVCTGPSGWPCTCSGQQRNLAWTCVVRGAGSGGSSATTGGSGTSGGKSSGGGSGTDAGGVGNEGGADSAGAGGAEGGTSGVGAGGAEFSGGAGGELVVLP